MNRTEKISLVDQIQQTIAATPHLVLSRFSGLTVNQANELRRRVRGAGGSYRVIKNRLVRRATLGTAVEPLGKDLRGPCALAGHATDPVVLAKVLTDFAKANPQIEIVAGVVDARALVDAEGVRSLAALPGLPQLRAHLLALIQTPATMLVRLLNTPATQLARVIDARRESLGEN